MKPYHVTRQRRDRSVTSVSILLLVFILTLILTACQGIASIPPTRPPTQVPATSAPQPTEQATTIDPTSAALLSPTRTPTAVLGNASPYPPTAAIGPEILFLRSGVLLAYDVTSNEERPIAKAVREFAATPDGRVLALVRDIEGNPLDIWLVNRDGSNLQQLTRNARAESSLSWAPDGQTLVYASSDVAPARPLDWMSWSAWCTSSEVHLITVANATETTLEPGCEPAFSSDGRRIAFVTPPTRDALEHDDVAGPSEINTIRLVNRQGANGWSFATATGYGDVSGMLVYAPAWSPDGARIAYQRFIGYHALADLNYTQMAGSFRGNGDLLSVGAG